ncbi:hypothetical protein N7495_006567 [Penicillium taxi]|uniref:uncharacterized protein n=1 Tax=Penicillium taxi TaxID=168475 RepID=UPI002545A75F|nr:uncharacterized protein N7495_006567 [Penicillium taxi]KAJ5894876.1 hypothetical protein N7495_006567 [Penicillium taxi]
MDYLRYGFSNEKYLKFEGNQITDDIVEDAANLFSSNYGVWGPIAEQKMCPTTKDNKKVAIGPLPFKQGQQVTMGLLAFKHQFLPPNGHNILIQMREQGHLLGYLVATRWDHKGRNVVWVTSLCANAKCRHWGVATKLLRMVRHGKPAMCYGILSPHPYAIRAAVRAWGNWPGDLDLTVTKRYAQLVMPSSPVRYVRKARLHGALFDESVHDWAVSCVDTNLWIDQEEVVAALAKICKNNIPWPFGNLPNGHEFLFIAHGSHHRAIFQRREDRVEAATARK